MLALFVAALVGSSRAGAEEPPPPAPSADETAPPPSPTPRESPASRERRKALKLVDANVNLALQLSDGQKHAAVWDQWEGQVRQVRSRRTNTALLLMGSGILTGLAAGSVPLWVDEKSMAKPLAAGLGLSIGLLIAAAIILPAGV